VAAVAACAFLLLGVRDRTGAAAFADPLDAGSGAVFRLGPGSTFQQGCVAPCECPTLPPQDVRGTFKVGTTGEVGGVQTFAIEDVSWTVPLEPPLRITGAGAYSLADVGTPPALQGRMELDLALGDQPPVHLDSGWQGGTGSRKINVTLSLAGGSCLEVVILVDASLVSESEIQHYELLPKSTFQRGCFGSCKCPVGPLQPLTGSFALVPLTETWYGRELAVVDARWVVHSDSDPRTIPVTGFGVYEVSGEVVPLQRLALDLGIGDEPRTRFESEPEVVKPDAARIDATLSAGARTCYDTVLHVVAERSPGRRCGGFSGLPCGTGDYCRTPVGQCCCDRFGVCTPVPDVCPEVWDPVCGCDGVTYDNECRARAATVSLAHHGACGGSCRTGAECDATFEYCRFVDGTCGATDSVGQCTAIPTGTSDARDPVCGCDGVTYRNEREAGLAAVSVRHRGACRDAPRFRRLLPPGRPGH